MRISVDLRQRAVQAYESGAGSLREIAGRFLIGEASLKRFLRLKRETGDVKSNKRHGGGTPPKIPGPELPKLAEVVAQKPDRTITEFRQEWYQQTGVKASHATMVRALQRANLTFKKKRFVPRNETQKKTD